MRPRWRSSRSATPITRAEKIIGTTSMKRSRRNTWPIGPVTLFSTQVSQGASPAAQRATSPLTAPTASANSSLL